MLPIDTTDKVLTIKPLTPGTAVHLHRHGEQRRWLDKSAPSTAVTPTAVTDTVSIGTGKVQGGQ